MARNNIDTTTTRPTPFIQTNYYNQARPWIKRGLIFSFALLAIIASFISTKEIYLIPIFTSIAFVLIFSISVEDVAVDQTHFYRLKRTILPYLSRTRKYELAQIAFIHVDGNYNSVANDIIAFFSSGPSTVNSMKIDFKDNTSVDFRIAIFRSDLDPIVQKIRDAIKRQS